MKIGGNCDSRKNIKNYTVTKEYKLIEAKKRRKKLILYIVGINFNFGTWHIVTQLSTNSIYAKR